MKVKGLLKPLETARHKAMLSGQPECFGHVVLVQTHPLRSALDLLAKNQGHIASGVLQQFLASDPNLGAKLQTLQQVNEQTAPHLGRGSASQAPRLHLLLETFRENISVCCETLREPGTDFCYPLRMSQRSGGQHAAAASVACSGVNGSLTKGGHGLVDVWFRLKRCHFGSSIDQRIALDGP